MIVLLGVLRCLRLRELLRMDMQLGMVGNHKWRYLLPIAICRIVGRSFFGGHMAHFQISLIVSLIVELRLMTKHVPDDLRVHKSIWQP